MESKSSQEILAEIYRNTQLALTSISDILPEIENQKLKEEIMRQHEEYERICGEASLLAKEKNLELKEPSAMKKAMMWSAIKMNTANDNSAQHIASLLIKGTVTGITSLKTSLTDGKATLDDSTKHLLKELISTEENFEKRLKCYL